MTCRGLKRRRAVGQSDHQHQRQGGTELHGFGVGWLWALRRRVRAEEIIRSHWGARWAGWVVRRAFAKFIFKNVRRFTVRSVET